MPIPKPPPTPQEQKAAEEAGKFHRRLGRSTIAVGKFTAGVTAGSIALKRMLSSVDQQIDELRRFSPQIAVAGAMLQRSRLINQRDMALATQGSTASLARAQRDLEREQQPLKRVGRTFGNVWKAGVTRLEQGLYRVLNVTITPALEKMAGYLEDLAGRGPTKPPYEQMLEDILHGDFDGPLGSHRPEHPPTPRGSGAPRKGGR